MPQLSPAAASSLKAPSQSRELRGATLENAASLVRSLARESSVKDLAATLPATPVRPLSLGEEMLEAIEGTESTGGEKPSAAYLTPPVAEKAELTSPVKAADLPPSPVQQSGMGLPESSDGRAQSHAQGAVSPEKGQAEAVSRSAAADDSSSKENQAEEEKFPAVEPVPAAAAYDPALSPEEGKAAMMAAAQSGSSLSDSPYPQEEAQHAASLSSTLNKVEAYLNQLSDTRDSLSQTKTRREDVLSSQLNALKDLGRSLSAGRVAPVGLSAPLQESVPGAALHDSLPEVSPLEANFAAVKNERAAEEGEKSLRDGLPSVNDTGTDLTQPSAKPGDLLPPGEENPATPEGRAVSVSDAPVQSTDPTFAVTADLPEAFKGLSLKGVAGDPFSVAQLSAGTGDSGEKAPDVLSLKSRLTAAGAMEIPPDSEDVSLRPAPEISDEELRRVQGVIDGTLSAQENTLIPQADAARPAPSPDFKERLAARSAELMATVGGSLQVTGKQPGLREGQEDALPAVAAVPAASDALPAVTAQRQVNAGVALPEVTSPESQDAPDALPAATALPHRGELSVAPPVSDVAPETESREQQETDAPSPAAAPAAKLPAEETDSTSYGTEELFVPVEDEAFDEEYVPADLPVDAYLDLPDPEPAPSPVLNQMGRLNDGDPQKLKAQGTYLPAEPLGKKDLMGKRYLGVDDFYADLEKEDPLFALVVKAGPDAMDLGVLCHAGLSFDREARLFKVTVQKPNLVAEKPAFARRLSTALSKALGESVTVEVSLVTELNGSTPYQGAQAVFARAIAARHTELMHNPEIRALCALFNEDPGTLGVELLTDAPADK